MIHTLTLRYRTDYLELTVAHSGPKLSQKKLTEAARTCLLEAMEDIDAGRVSMGGTAGFEERRDTLVIEGRKS